MQKSLHQVQFSNPASRFLHVYHSNSLYFLSLSLCLDARGADVCAELTNASKVSLTNYFLVHSQLDVAASYGFGSPNAVPLRLCFQFDWTIDYIMLLIIFKNQFSLSLVSFHSLIMRRLQFMQMLYGGWKAAVIYPCPLFQVYIVRRLALGALCGTSVWLLTVVTMKY